MGGGELSTFMAMKTRKIGKVSRAEASSINI